MAPNPLLVRFSSLLADENLEGPILDLACGRGENGLFLAGLNLLFTAVGLYWVGPI